MAAAGENFRARGLDGVGIDELMKAAGLTHGGFYNHFASKDALALEVLHQGFTDSLAVVDDIVRSHPRSARASLRDVVDTYLDAHDRDHPEVGCPSHVLAADAARHGTEAAAEYRRGLDGYLATITDLLLRAAEQTATELTPAEARAEAIAMFSQMVGAQVVARAVANADRALSDEVLGANRRSLRRRT